jgi:hypothetical protein
MKFEIQARRDTVVPSSHFNEDKEEKGSTCLWGVESPRDIQTEFFSNTNIEKHRSAKFIGHV